MIAEHIKQKKISNCEERTQPDNSTNKNKKIKGAFGSKNFNGNGNENHGIAKRMMVILLVVG